jgi:spore germination protein KC
MKKLSRMLLVLLPSIIILSGCWDRTEINDLAFVLTTGVDLEKDGKIRFTVMVPLPGQMGGATGGGGGTAGEKSYYIDSEVGETFTDAFGKLQKRMSRRMNLAHRRTLLVGEELAKSGIRDLFDAPPRNPENRMTTYLIVTKGKAYEMMQATPKFERFPSEAIRELVKSRAVMDINLKDMGVALSSPGLDPVAVYMAVKESEKSEKPSKEVEVKGYVQFKDAKMVGTLEDESALGLTWARGKENIIGIITLPIDKEHMISAKIYNTRTNIQIQLINQQAHFTIEVKAKAKLSEDRSYYDLSQTQKSIKVESDISNYIKKAIQSVIDKSIKNNADSVHLGTVLWRNYPDEWKRQFEKDWPQGLKNAQVDIHVQTELTDTGLIYDNVTKRSTHE